ncbi:hypothetical protein B0T22DRAFT_470717 [Podospora appendiculata]|uniref:Secreted protein n=1 Tax=Podospora appendiculata TaxID=314037 RepID=A0AAE0X0Q4_9PEZI|nr:hypothetical protein B0T22DRAFT_470717 [Podospora appendiculata]
MPWVWPWVDALTLLLLTRPQGGGVGCIRGSVRNKIQQKGYLMRLASEGAQSGVECNSRRGYGQALPCSAGGV